MLLLGSGWIAEQVAEALLIDPNSVPNPSKCYREGDLKALRDGSYGGSECLLGIEVLAQLQEHLKAKLYPTAKAIAAWVEESVGVSYSPSGMTALLHRLGFVYKRAKLVPGKADPEAQKRFLADYQKLKENNTEGPITFMDATHPQHNAHPGFGWIKRGEDQASGRRRLNINGAIEIKGLPASSSSSFSPTPPTSTSSSGCGSSSRKPSSTTAITRAFRNAKRLAGISSTTPASTIPNYDLC